jgi:hypothetical protein
MKFNNTDDYRYIKHQILETPNLSIEDLKENLKHNEYAWVQNLIITAKFHWGLGGGKKNDFPKAHLVEVIDDVIKDILNDVN